MREGALADVTILDLASEVTAYGTKILSDLGAEVIRIEPPHGEKMRSRGPFYGGKPDAEGSLRHLHFNANKRSVTLDITQPRGAEILRSLVQKADVLVESYAPGYLDGLNLGYEHLRAMNPGIIMVSVTPFGQNGPHSQYVATDMIASAMGGFMILNGFPEDPPAVPGAEQSYHMAGLVAAAGTMVAVFGRDRSADGAGAHLDISMQEAVAMTTLQTANANFYTWHGTVNRRRGLAGTRAQDIFRCRDGWVSVRIPPVVWESLITWLKEVGIEGELAGEIWKDAGHRLENPWPINRALEDLCSRFTQAEIYHEGQGRKLLCMPVNTVADLLADEQLNAWGFYVDIDHPELGVKLRDAGPPCHLSETPATVRRRAPRLGEDNEAIYASFLGLSAGELASLRSSGIV